MSGLVLLLMAVICTPGLEVSSLGGFLVSVQSKFTGMDDSESITWKHGCSGTVISIRSALTCASCVVYSDDRLGLQTVDYQDLRLYAGSESSDDADNDPNGKIYYVRAVQVHPEFASNEMGLTPNEFNFAILIAKNPFQVGDSLKVLPLYSEDVDDVRRVLTAYGTKCFTMTWYFYMDGKPVNEKPEFGEIPVALEKINSCGNVSRILSSLSLAQPAESAYFCAKGLNKLPICRVDTGSPIVCEGKLLAIIINDRLDCDNDEKYVVITGINNALAFLTDPELYSLTAKPAIEEKLTTIIVERGRSSRQARALPEIVTLMLQTTVLIYSIKYIISDL